MACSRLQERGRNRLNFTVQCDEIICVDSSNDKLVVKFADGWTQVSNNKVTSSDMFEMLTTDPVGKEEVLVRVIDVNDVDIAKKKSKGYRT